MCKGYIKTISNQPSSSLRIDHLVEQYFFHTQGWCALGLWACEDSSGWYFALKVLAKRDWGLLISLQYYFANKAWFIGLNFLMPRPPHLLGLHILSQLIKWSFFSPGSWPHQKDLTIESILLQIDLGTLKQEKVYKGRDWRTEEMRVVLPTCERSLAFQPCSLELSLSIRKLKINNTIPSQLKIDTKVFARVLDKVHIQTSSYGFLTFLEHVWGVEKVRFG